MGTTTWLPGLRTSVAAVICSAAAMIGLTLFLGPATSEATPHRCPDVMFIGARGSGEPLQVKKNGKMVTVYQGVGKPIDYMAGLLEKDVVAYGEEMQVLPVIYKADGVEDLIPSKSEVAEMALGGAAAIYYERNYKPYAASIADGVTQTIADVHSTVDRCPETELVLGGYSQGAMAVHQAELQLERDGDEEALDAIGGTLLLGDGDRAPNTQAKIFGGAPSSGEGVQVYLHGAKAADVAEPETTAEICARGDIVCDFKLHLDKAWYEEGAHVHTSYNVEPQQVFLRQAVAWLAEEMGLDLSSRSARRGGIPGARATSAVMSSFRTCGPLGYAPKNGGYGLIIEKMHVQRVTCRRAARIGGAFYAGDPMPAGWGCSYSGADYFTLCRYRSSLHAFRFIFGGDAGRAEALVVGDCGPGHQVAHLATILSVRNMSCGGAEGALREGDGVYETPIGLGAKAKIGGFRCHVYEDDTPPGPSDVDEKLRCVHGRKAFRYRYAV